jgi:hypothetical protein
MVHAFCGVVISYIDEDWVLHEYVVDLIFFDGDHSGKAVGRLVSAGDICEDAFFSSLILGNYNFLAADPASSNGPLNKSIAKRCAKINPDTSSARNIQIGCSGHVTNIVAQSVFVF